MVSGFERYYQIARCFRDEDLRADRQPDFTQLDIEMSFVEVEDVIETNERLMKHVLAVAGIEIELPIPRIPYDEAMARFGTDRPDIRFGMELVDLSEDLRDTEFRVFRGTLDSGGVVKGMNCGARELPRAQLDGLISRGAGARRQGPGLGVPRGGRMALADREVPHRGRAGRAQLAPRRERGRPAARRRRLPRRRQRGPRDAARPPGRALGARSRRGRTRSAGSSTGRSSSGTTRATPGSRCTTRSPPGRASWTPTTRDRPAPAPTTSSGTGRRSAAARSGSPTRPTRRASSSCSESAPRRRRPASASCSRRCATGRPRTAASPTASTGSARWRPGATRSAT